MIQKFISKLSGKEKKILYVTIGVVLMAFMDRLFLGPVTAKLSVLDEDIKTQENSIKRDLRFLSYKDRIIKERKLLNKYYVKKMQSEEEIIAAFLKRIEMLASDSKITLVKVTPTESAQKKGYIEYYASLECTGKLKDVVTFMHLIDSSPELLKIIKFSISAKKASPDEVLSSMTVSKIIVEAENNAEVDAGGAEPQPVSAVSPDAMSANPTPVDAGQAIPVTNVPAGTPVGNEVNAPRQP